MLVFLVAEHSKAGTVAIVNNRNGGIIFFDDQACPEKIGLLAHVMAKDGKEVHGCWRIMENGLVVKWVVESEPVIFYPANEVVVMKKGTGV